MKLYDNDAYREEFMSIVYGLLMDDNTNDRANQIISAFDCAPEIEAEPIQPNDPLTFEELLEIEGEPVYFVSGALHNWNVINHINDGEYRGYVQFIDRTVESLYDYGVTWSVYRRKPEEV